MAKVNDVTLVDGVRVCELKIVNAGDADKLNRSLGMVFSGFIVKREERGTRLVIHFEPLKAKMVVVPGGDSHEQDRH